jgi:hypothetical protein
MIQVVIGWQCSFGFHIDFRKPYMDIHILWVTFSFGYKAPYSSWFDSARWDSRGGIRDESIK